MGNAPAHMNASQIFQNEDIYRLIMEHTRDLIRVIDVDFNFVYVSPSHETVLGYTVDEMLHGSGLDILHPDDKDTAISMHRQMIMEDTMMDGLFRFQCKNGEWVTLETRGRSLVKDGKVVGVVTVGRDVTERLRMEKELKDYEEQLKFLAFHDPLTALPNRSLFFEITTQAIREAKLHGCRVAMLFIDCDDFKKINDAYGHHIGDEAVKELGKRLALAVGDRGTVARIGGDEFTVLLPSVTSRQDVVEVVDRVLRSTHSVWDVNGFGIHLTVSIGVAVSPLDGLDADTLFRHADTALYDAKQQGKNRCVFFGSER